MTITPKFISRKDFHDGEHFKKLNKHIDICLELIRHLLAYNAKCKSEVASKLQIDSYIIDYRADQFGYYENVLKGIYFSCHSLKYSYDISTSMNHSSIENGIIETLDNQRKYITFNAIVRLSSIFEYTRGVYERNVKPNKKGKGKSYFELLKERYSDKVDSMELLNDFRNTIHSNGKWNPRKGKGDLVYQLREGQQVIKTGEMFTYDHWKLYSIVKDCLELNKLMALDNETERLRVAKFEIKGKKIGILQTKMTLKDWDDLAKRSNLR